MNTHNTRTFYLRNIPRYDQWIDGHRGDPFACMMTKLDRENGFIKYSVAASHPKDGFDRVLGRTIAKGRLESCPRVIAIAVPNSGHEITRIIMQDIITHSEHVSSFTKEYINQAYSNDWKYHIPGRVVAAAKRWLNDAKRTTDKHQYSKAGRSAQEQSVANNIIVGTTTASAVPNEWAEWKSIGSEYQLVIADSNGSISPVSDKVLKELQAPRNL